MKKCLPYIRKITLAAAGLGILLRLWLLLVGQDDKALYPKNHISWVLLLVLSAALLIFLFLLGRFAGKNRLYAANFPPSLAGAVGYALGGMGLIFASIPDLAPNPVFLYPLTAVLGLLSGAALLWGGYCRWKGKTPHFGVFMAPCFYFCLRLFCLGHTWGNEPEMSRFLLPFLATAACALACWQHWGFSVDLGNRPLSLLSSLMAIYLCLVCLPGNGDFLLYLTTAAWLYLNLCPVKLPRRRIPAQPEAPAPAPTPESTPASAPENPVSDDELDRILAEILEQHPMEEE